MKHALNLMLFIYFLECLDSCSALSKSMGVPKGGGGGARRGGGDGATVLPERSKWNEKC